MPLPVRAECSAYPALFALFGGDAGSVETVVRVFYHSAAHDLRQMEIAATSGCWSLLRQLAHRVASGCRHVGEDAAADAFAAIEDLSCDSVYETPLAQMFRDARGELVLALERAAAYAGIDGPHPALPA